MFSVALVCLSVCKPTLLQQLWTDCDEILWRGQGWYIEALVIFCDLGLLR